MRKIKLILNILYWAFEILSRLCGHAEEIIKSYEDYSEYCDKRKKKKR